MTGIAFRATATSILSTLMLVSPALAQDMSTKDQWGALRDTLRERGVMVAAQGVVDTGDGLTLSDVRVFSLEDPTALVFDIAQLVVTQNGDLLVLTPSPEFTATASAGREERVFTITHDGAFETAVSDDEITLNMDFGQLAIALTSAMRGETALNEQFSVTLDGVDADSTFTRAGSADVTLVTQGLAYAYDLGPGMLESPLGQSATFQGEGMEITLSARELDLLELLDTSDTPAEDLFAGGFMAQLDLSFGAGSGTGVMAIEGMPLSLTTQSEPGSMSIAFTDGRFDMAGMTGALDYAVVDGPVTGTARADALSFGFGAPLVAMPQTSPAYYRVGFENLVIDSPALALAGLQDFAGETLNLTVDLSADMRLTQALSEDSIEADLPPFDVTTVTLAQLLLGVGDASLTGSGAFTFDGGLLASVDGDVPDGTGDFLFELIGGNAFLQRLTAAGLVPEEQVFVAQMMMNGLGQSVGADHLRSEVAIRPGGVITVNGAPIPF